MYTRWVLSNLFSNTTFVLVLWRKTDLTRVGKLLAVKVTPIEKFSTVESL